MTLRAEWIPTGRRRWHPADDNTLRWGVTGVAFFAFILLLRELAQNGPTGGAVRNGGFAVLVGATAWIISRVGFEAKRDRRAFADLGERQEDMAEVRVRLYRRGAFLGEDQGFWWVDGHGTAFQGARLAFRLPGGLVREFGGRHVARYGDDERLVVERIEGDVRVAETPDDSPATFPPSTPDPEMEPPESVTRSLVICTGYTSAFGHLWGLIGMTLLTVALLVPMIRDRRVR